MTDKTTMTISRRDLFTAGGACGIAAMQPACAALVGQDEAALKAFHATCSMECLHCYLKAYVKDGKIVRIESDNAHEGKGCARGLSRIKWVYAENRIRTPLKRVGKRGEGKFKAISWDEALDEVAAQMKKAIDTDGSKSILMTSASGNMDSFANSTMKSLGAHLGGVTFQNGSLCCSAVTAAMNAMVGFRYVDTRDTIADSKYIVCWGNNPLVTMQAYWPRYLKAKENGAKIVVIDPRRNETAMRADAWIPIVPGTDPILALGMIRIFEEEKLLDTAFLKAHTGAPFLVDADGNLLLENAKDPASCMVFDLKSKKVVRHDTANIDPALDVKGLSVPRGVRTALTILLDEARPWTLKRVEEETRVPAAIVRQLARDYAKSGASMIVDNMGSFQRVENGTYAAAAHFYLALLTGNIGRKGTGVCDAGGVTQMAKFGAPIPAPAKKPVKVPGIPTAKLGEYLLAHKPHKINVWYSQTCAPIGQWPNANKVIEAIKSVPFVVVADNLMTPTAKYADIVLPCTTIFEYKTLMAGTRNHFVQWSDEAVKPEGEAKPDYWIIAQLAKRLGCGKAFDLTPEQMAENVLKPSGITLAEVKKHPVCPVKGPWVPFEGGVFRTPTKKGQIYIEDWLKKGFSPVLTFIRAKESPKGNPELAKKYPLQAVQRKVIRNIHTSHQDNAWLKEVFADAPTVIMNKKDAAARKIADGDMVIVYNDRGEHKARAVVGDGIISGAVALENGWWQDKDGFNSSSVLTNDTIEVLGTATTINSTLVNVRKA